MYAVLKFKERRTCERNVVDLIPTTGVGPSIASPAISKRSSVSVTTSRNAVNSIYFLKLRSNNRNYVVTRETLFGSYL
jgi:hypothetical protein